MWNAHFGAPLAFGKSDVGPRLILRWLSWAAVILIRAYRLLVSPLLPGNCRFTPSCSHYAEEAFHRHSLHRALWLSIRRVARCHPRHPGGEDPVP